MLKKHAQEAYAVQDACNPLAIANTFAEAVGEMYEALGGPQKIGFSDFRRHPEVRVIVGAWLCKLDDLFGYPLTDNDTSWMMFKELDIIRLSEEAAESDPKE